MMTYEYVIDILLAIGRSPSRGVCEGLSIQCLDGHYQPKDCIGSDNPLQIVVHLQ